MAVARARRSQPTVTIWRLAKAGRASFDGEGARLYGGRWSHPGVRVVYTSAHLSLAALELFVHVDTDLLPDDLVAIRAEIPGGMGQERLDAGGLPRDWRTSPAPEALQDLGTEWVRRGESAVLSVPSAVIPEERNYLLNPEHRDFAGIRIDPPHPFEFDPRMRG